MVPDAAVGAIGIPEKLGLANLAYTSLPPINICLPDTKLTFSEEVQALVADTQLNVLSVDPFNVIPPPFAVTSVGLAISPSVIFLSSTESVAELIVVVVPFTVKSPERIRLGAFMSPVKVAPDNDALLSNAVCVALEIGFKASLVLLTFPNPRLDAVTPLIADATNCVVAS